MFSRAHLLIERDYEKLQEEDLWGIEAHPLKEDSLFEFTAKILGLKGSLWEGGIFRLYIKFDANYNSRPPQICFHTIPFHPNVDVITGYPCLDFLEKWKESYSLSYILLAVQMLLSNPVLENAVNQEAVEMIVYSPHTFKQIVQDCVAASQRLEAGLDAHLERPGEQVRLGPSKDVESSKPQTPKTGAARAAKISFEDYHITWSGIATSKSQTDMKNPLLETIKDNPVLQAAHYGLPVEELQTQMEKQFHEHSTLMYGHFKTKPTEEEIHEAKMEKVNKMRKMYLPPRVGTPRRTPIPLDEVLDSQEEPWEREADDLVNWTTKLDENLL